MKCANETVTIELKNGTHLHSLSFRLSDQAGAASNVCKFPIPINEDLYRYDSPRHHHVRLAANEHSPSRRENDSPRPRSDFARHDQYPRLDDPILHPAGLAATGYAADRRCAEAEEQGAEGGGG